MEMDSKSIEHEHFGLKLGGNESQYHDKANGTSLDPKYSIQESRNAQIPKSGEIRVAGKCSLNLAINRMGVGGWGGG